MAQSFFQRIIFESSCRFRVHLQTLHGGPAPSIKACSLPFRISEATQDQYDVQNIVLGQSKNLPHRMVVAVIDLG